MGNFHCITSSCATVVYREYLSPVVRWRYPQEEWQEIQADDYAVEQELGKCETFYSVWGKAAKNGINYCETPNPTNAWGFSIRGPVHGLKSKFERQDNRYSCSNSGGIVGVANVYLAYISAGDNPDDIRNSIIYFYEPHTLNDVVIVEGIARNDGLPDNCGDCIFTITLNGETVYTETRDTCPEVEILPCRLSDVYKEIKIDKFPYLSAIEILPFARDAEKINGVPYPLPTIKPIPSECLNIYRNEAFDPLPGGNSDLENEPVFADYITQICSVPNCPPPEYEVICDCVERCPPNTCSVVCGDKLCCYDKDGISQKSIPLSNFFPNNTTGGNPR